MTYIRTAIATSRHPRPHPQATGTAAISARNGTAMKIARTTFSHPALRSDVMTGSGLCGRAAGGTSDAATADALTDAGAATAEGAVDGGVMAILGVGGAGYATVTYASVAC